MAGGGRRRSRSNVNIWPGFVDALSSLLLVIIFVLLVFVLAQFYMGQALSGRNEQITVLSRQLSQLTEMLNVEKQNSAAHRVNIGALNEQARTQAAETDALRAKIAEGAEAESKIALLQNDIAALLALKADLEKTIAEQGGQLGEKDGALAEEKRLSETARAQAALLNQQIEAMKDELARLAVALDASETLSAEQKVQIVDLGKRLNAALASKVEELSRYRSNFFGKMREVLGNRSNIRIEGDRFVIQSELLFASGSDELGEAGRQQLAALAQGVLQVSKELPTDVNWVLRVDGHTDALPIRSDRFPSNWELSAARAIAVVKFLMAQGVPGNRLSAAGFGSYQPIDKGDSPEALAKNRRIELRFDQIGETAAAR